MYDDNDNNDNDEDDDTDSMANTTTTTTATIVMIINCELIYFCLFFVTPNMKQNVNMLLTVAWQIGR